MSNFVRIIFRMICCIGISVISGTLIMIGLYSLPTEAMYKHAQENIMLFENAYLLNDWTGVDFHNLGTHSTLSMWTDSIMVMNAIYPKSDSVYRQGKGNVIRSMFRDIDADCYIITDGDDTYPADSAREMCDMILSKKADMVVGDRLSTTYFQENKRSFHGFGNKLVQACVNCLWQEGGGYYNKLDIMTGYLRQKFSNPIARL